MCVAITLRIGQNPLLGLCFVGQVGHVGFRGIPQGNKIRFAQVFPAILIFFHHAAAAFRKTCVANLIVIEQHFAKGFIHSLHHMRIRFFRNALITLAMVVGTHIEKCVILAVIPPNMLRFGLHK